MQKKFSYPLKVADLPQQQQRYNIEASAEQLSELEEILKVPAANALKAEISLKKDYNSGILHVFGHIRCTLTFESVVSLEMFKQEYDFDFELVYDTKATPESQHQDEEDWTDELPDVIIGGEIDLADVAIEQIALQIDDYPRRPGEDFNFNPEFDPEEKIAVNPFEILAKLKK